MKRKVVVSYLILVLLLFSGCASEKTASQQAQLSPLEQILDIYKTTIKSNDSAETRAGIVKLEDLTNDGSFTEEEQKTAKLALNVCTGIVKLSMYEKGVSAFAFPEIDYLQTCIAGITTQQDFAPLDEALQASETFLAKVNDYIK